jgi:amino acid transporter
MVDEPATAGRLERTIDWKQGLAIAIGVPLLILPSIGYFAGYLWSFAIVVWGLSVLQGFMQNIAYGELATTFPNVSGLPGIAQTVFNRRNAGSKYDGGKLIGGFSAWSYWFAWNPVLAIFAILIGSHLKGLVPALGAFSELQLSLISGFVIFSFLIIINSRGLSSGATLGYVLAFLSFAPLIVITLLPFGTGDFAMANIVDSWLPEDWLWDGPHILILLGLFAIAQWSACAWETAAIYGPEYRKPHSDVPKALFACGGICLLAYVLVQAAVTGTLGIEGILAEPISPMLPLARATMGAMGVNVSIVMLIAAMVLIIQTAFLGSARAMHSLAVEGNLPRIFGKINAHGTPIFAMIVIGIFNLALIMMKTPTVILAASAIGYVCANGISLFAYVKAKKNPALARLERPFKAPSGWANVALLFGLFNLPLCLVGVVYLNSRESGWTSAAVGFVVLASYIPLWIYSQHESAMRRAGGF